MHKFTFNGKSSSDFSTYISGSGTYDAPKRDVSTVEIPGRNGSLTIDNGRYENIDLKYPAFIRSNFKANTDALRAFMLRDSAYHRLEDDYHPEQFRMAKFVGPIEFDVKTLNRAGEFTLIFDCMPQRWLKSGETAVEFTAAGTLSNPTLYEAAPLIRVYGTSGVLIVGNLRIEITEISEYVDIDSDSQNAFKETLNCNQNITTSKFPSLPPGETGISFEGDITKVVITPRWWTI